MPRPSRNLDQALLAAGRRLFAERGCANLSIREVAEAARVNPGMFHYHFRTREAFLRTLLQQAYEEMFARLTIEVAREATPVENLRAALRVLGRFLRDNQPFLARVLADALCGEPITRDFLRANVPRHFGILRALIAEGQRAGALRPMPASQALASCAGAIALPILAGGAIVASGALAPRASRSLAAELLSDQAIDERIELALSALSMPASGSSTRRRRGAP